MRSLVPWVGMSVAIVAHAPRASAAEDPAVRDAQRRFEEGLDRVKAGNYEAARISFAQAYALLKRPAILWNLALAEEKTEHLVEALSHFKRVARDPAATSGDREDAQRHAEALAARTGHLDVQAPAGSSLRVDGAPVEAAAPLEEPIDVMPGHHVVEATWAEETRALPVDAAQGQIVRVSFGPAGGSDSTETAAPPGSGSPGGTGPAQSAPFGIDRRPARRPAISTADIVITASIGGAAAVSLVSGIALAFESRSQANRAAGYRAQFDEAGTGNASCFGASATPACSALNDAVAAQNRDAEVSDGLYVTAGVLAAGALATWFLWPRNEPGAWIVPVVGASQVGLRAGGKF